MPASLRIARYYVKTFVLLCSSSDFTGNHLKVTTAIKKGFHNGVFSKLL